MNVLAAPSLGAQFLGPATTSGLALAASCILYWGWRGSDLIRLENKYKMGGWGIFTGILMTAAGGSWADVANGVGGVPASVIGSGNPLGNPGQGIVALILTLAVFAPKWKRLIFPALLGISAAVTYGTAGGVWSIFSNTARMAIGHWTGAA